MIARGPRAALLALLLATAGLGPAGCAGFIDDVSSSEFWKRNWFQPPPPPLEVLKDDTDGDHRARALRALTEPSQRGGSQQEQDMVVTILCTAANKERQALCRLAAIDTLAHFKDQRVVTALKEAYYGAGDYNPAEAAWLKCRTLEALGEVGDPGAVELLVKVLKEPPVEGPDEDRQLKAEERHAAARALGKFKQPPDRESSPAVAALTEVLKTERKDIALRSRVRQSLEEATGRSLPPDDAAPDEAPRRNGDRLADGDGRKDAGVLPAGWK
jgi:hypothetical protein